MASWQVQQLAATLAEDKQLRTSFRRDPQAALQSGGFELGPDELEALRMVKWSEMDDEEMLVRLRGAAARGTHQTA
jgi:predicted DNA-binding protein (UPF0251 family)